MPLIFQFHIGTIKSFNDVQEWPMFSLFQFHIGTIKSIIESFGNGTFYYFNSTLVQLKETEIHKRLDGTTISIPHWYN